MKNRSRDYYRHQRKRVINKKLDIIKNAWHNDDHPWIKEPGNLSKAKLNCSCKMCKYEKHYHIPAPKTKSKLDLMELELEWYLNDSY